MADAREYVGELRRIADEIEHMKPGSAWVCREAAALIERLTKPMTLQRAAEVMTERQHHDRSWSADDGGHVMDNYGTMVFFEFEAKAIARAYEAEKEAARA